MTLPVRFEYRKDIDGLRAVAVLSVLFFHFNFGIFRGGFVGVDIFFVISGYLITSIILKDLDSGRFSFSVFFQRRVKRIFPALALMLIASSIAGYIFLFPAELVSLNRHIIAGTGFFTNILLWQEAGYFDAASELKPLLHLWSLSVEEQFYLVCPVLLVLVFKNKKYLWSVLLVFTFASFVFNLATVKLNPMTAFYLPVSRFWEILAGCLLAYAQFAKVLSGKYKKSASIIGFLFILLAALSFRTSTVFPGYNALLPVLGTVLLIYGGSESPVNRQILERPILVWVGQISYPLYLWHWPILSFLTIMTAGNVTLPMKVFGLFLSFVLAALTFYLLEKPIRFSQNWSLKKTSAALIALLVVNSAVSVLAIHENQKKFNPFETADFSNTDFCHDQFKIPKNNYCGISQKNNEPTVMLIGDSHSRHFFSSLKAHYDNKGETLIALGRGGCLPFVGTTRFTSVEGNLSCDKIINSALDFMKNHSQIHTVIIAAAYSKYLNSIQPVDSEYASWPKEKIFRESFIRTLKHIKALGKKIVVIYQVPKLPFSPQECVQRGFDLSSVKESCDFYKTDFLSERSSYLRLLDMEFIKAENIQVFDPSDYLCDSKKCYAMEKQQLLYADDEHLSVKGTEFFADKFVF